VVVHLESPAFSDVTIRENRIEAGAAVPVTALISQAARAGLAGLEILTGIPGTVGAAIRGNAGGRQGAIGQFVRRITVIDEEGQVRVREHEELTFAHQWTDLDDPLILSAEFELTREDPDAVVKRMRRVWIVKRENQPYGHQLTGYIFKSPSAETSAGLVIEHAGMKGAQSGGAEVSERHANYIIAHPGATAVDVLALIDQVREQVRRQFGLNLELQIQIW
jgi:UDP-N-acetylmuramate dehydrogenase